jgi:hypothetical protein
LDNAAYVQAGESVSDHLGALTPDGTEMTLLAVDGSVTRETTAQLSELPTAATHLFVSSGGNDALQSQFRLFDGRGGAVTGVLQELATCASQFREDYSRLMRALAVRDLPTVVFTVYDAIPELHEIQRTLLSVFNDVIVQEAVGRGLPIIDLRQHCTEPEDYSEVSPIEPSGRGGRKIAETILQVMMVHDFSMKQSVVY